VHSRHARRLADAAIGGRRVVIRLTIRRFFCGCCAGCKRKTFAEQVPGLTARYARKTPPLARGQQTIPLPDTGTLPEDLRTFLRSTIDSADPVTVRVLHDLAAAAASDESLAREIRDRFLATRRAALGLMLGRGVARGEIERDYAALAMDLVYGSMWYRLIFQVGPLDYTWADQVAAAIAPPRTASI
jgi:hypothetical protein